MFRKWQINFFLLVCSLVVVVGMAVVVGVTQLGQLGSVIEHNPKSRGLPLK